MKRIDVTKTYLPPLDEYTVYLRQIWDSSQLTNQGPLLQGFESEIKDYLSIDDFHFVGNGTIALQVGLRALDITEGEIITTPFSYVATTSSILWERCKPVFVDIESNTFCIDADKIEAAITPQTKAIMAVHVFGFPCDVDKIEMIARRHNIRVLYDAAHAFGVVHKGKSLLAYGDIATCSFHATKLFHTIEGGCIVARDPAVSKKVELIKHFGHFGDDHQMLGINAKASELQAAMGLVNLTHIDEIIAGRKIVFELYNNFLNERFTRPKLSVDTSPNYAYYPVLFESEAQLLRAVTSLNKQNIFPRRYFYPSLNTISYVDGESCPISEDIALRVLCLPLYVGLEREAIETIAATINGL
ncbi:MAG: DegT/DnrJ/EryC1/StrS family aminotransferase [Cytophaga sp.]|nr:DegT/DnrJ/EryC1/StrS family aminotransferase [Undibacterium sp.]